MSVINQMLRDLDKRQAPDALELRQPVVVAKTWPRWLRGLWLLPPLWLGVHFSAELSALFSVPAVMPGRSDISSAAPRSDVQVAVPTAAQAMPAPAHSLAKVAAVSEPAVPDTATAQAVVSQSVAAGTTSPGTASATEANTAEASFAAEQTGAGNSDAENIAMAHIDGNTIEADAIEAEPAGSVGADPEHSEAYALTPDRLVAEPASVAVPPQMRVTVSDPAQAEPQYLQAKALQAQASGQWRDAETAWLELIRLRPKASNAYEALAQLYLQQQQPALLNQLLQQAQQQQVESVALQWTQVQALAAGQHWAALLQALTPALQQQFQQQALALEAHAAQQLGQTERALQAYRRWRVLAPQDSRAWLGLAVLLDQGGQWPQAQQAYQQALQLGGLTEASRQFIQQRLAQDIQS